MGNYFQPTGAKGQAALLPKAKAASQGAAAATNWDNPLFSCSTVTAGPIKEVDTARTVIHGLTEARLSGDDTLYEPAAHLLPRVGSPGRSPTAAITARLAGLTLNPVSPLHPSLPPSHRTMAEVGGLSSQHGVPPTAADPAQALLCPTMSDEASITMSATGASFELTMPSDSEAAAAAEWADSLPDEPVLAGTPPTHSLQTDSSQSSVSGLVQSAAAHEDEDAPRCFSPIFGIEESQAAAANTEQAQCDAATIGLQTPASKCRAGTACGFLHVAHVTTSSIPRLRRLML